MSLVYKIPTRHNTWHVHYHSYDGRVEFFSIGKGPYDVIFTSYWPWEVPKSIIRRARPFFANPKLFGKWERS